MKRRTLLKAGLLQTGVLGMPVTVLASYPSTAFKSREIPAALTEVLGEAEFTENSAIEIEAPHIASDAGVVPVRIRSGLENTESISIIVERNPAPFTAYFKLYESQNFVSTRIKMAETSDLLVVVKANGNLHASRRRVRVGLASCEV